MTELKFRAWDNVTKRYWNVGGLSFEKGKLIEVYLENYPTSFEGNEDCKKPDDVILEQNTGLKDKNDKEIYEGDIVLVNGNIRYYVDFEFGGFWLNNDNIKWKANRAFTHFVEWNDIEVIGNIHENPELLEKEK